MAEIEEETGEEIEEGWQSEFVMALGMVCRLGRPGPASRRNRAANHSAATP